jgi:hypothetical protein
MESASLASHRSWRHHCTVVCAGVSVVALLTIVGFAARRRLCAGGALTYASLGIDPRRAAPDALIDAVAGTARGWAADARWWAINVPALRADGTVDLTDGGAVITYVSPSRVVGGDPQVRQDVMKEFVFGADGIRWARTIGARKPWLDVTPPATPRCTLAALSQVLRTRGLPADATVHVTFDPRLARGPGAPAVDSWRVVGAAIDGWFSLADCTPIGRVAS